MRPINKNDSVIQSLDIIESRISEKLTVENIADSVYFFKNHYQRLFREVVGNSVMEYVTKRKLTLAGRMLLETDAAIIDIAMDYGFDSREGFTRSFKTYMGVTPTEYRKFGLAAIGHKTVKERTTMKYSQYSKTTDEILRELNDFIAKAKESAEAARKLELPWYKEYWNSIADKTDNLAAALGGALARVAAITEHPDEITGRFNIVKLIDDTGFTLHATVFSMELTIARAKPEDSEAMQPICEQYRSLTAMYPQKQDKIVRFFRELAALIFDDMRKTLTVKTKAVVNNARSAANQIHGYEYIKEEFAHMADALETIPSGEITAQRLNDELFKLPIVQLAIDADVIRSGGKDKAMFDAVEPLKKSLEDAIEFIRSLPKPETGEPVGVKTAKFLDDVGYQGNILLFFTRGEAEKLGELLNEEQKAGFDKVCERIDHYIHFTQSSADETAFKPIADRVYEIYTDISALADELGEYGGAVKFIGLTFKQLYNKVADCMKAFENQKAEN